MHERHGLHVHVVTTRYVRVEAVRAVIWRQRKSTWGRIHVEKAKASIGPYLGKYLSKPRPECLKGWRMWAALDAKSYNHTRVADVILECLFSSVWQAATRCFGWKGNGKFAIRKSMVLTLSKLCMCWDCEPGLFPAPDGTMRPWALDDPDFADWYRFGFQWAVERALCPVENTPF
jgi:hypothetical protein